MKEDTKKALMTGRKMGAIAGGIMFVLFGIVPGFYFGSFATLSMMSHLMGPLEPSIIVRAILVVGVAVGLFCVAALSIVVGALTGTTLAFIAESITGAVAKPAADEAHGEAK